MNKRLFVTLSMAGLAMVAFGARKPKAAIKSSVKTVPSYSAILRYCAVRGHASGSSKYRSFTSSTGICFPVHNVNASAP